MKGAENVSQIINLIVYLKQTEEVKKLRETMGIVSKDFSIEMGLFEVEELTYLKEGIYSRIKFIEILQNSGQVNLGVPCTSLFRKKITPCNGGVATFFKREATPCR